MCSGNFRDLHPPAELGFPFDQQQLVGSYRSRPGNALVSACTLYAFVKHHVNLGIPLEPFLSPVH